MFTSVHLLFSRGGSILRSRVDLGLDFTGVDFGLDFTEVDDDNTPSSNCVLQLEYYL